MAEWVCAPAAFQLHECDNDVLCFFLVSVSKQTANVPEGQFVMSYISLINVENSQSKNATPTPTPFKPAQGEPGETTQVTPHQAASFVSMCLLNKKIKTF